MRAGASRYDDPFVLLSPAAAAGEDGEDGVKDALEDAPAFVGIRRWRGSVGEGVEVDCARRTRWVAYIAGEREREGKARQVKHMTRLHTPFDGRTLSFALRLRNRNSGTNQTQMAKKVEMSPNDGVGSPRL
jgi:hypothetical protein